MVTEWSESVSSLFRFVHKFTKSDFIIMSVISSAHIEHFGSMEQVFVKLCAGDFY